METGCNILIANKIEKIMREQNKNITDVANIIKAKSSDKLRLYCNITEKTLVKILNYERSISVLEACIIAQALDKKLSDFYISVK